MNADVLATVLDVACLTVDRSREEQRAMLEVALAVDAERGAFTTSNFMTRTPCAPVMVKLVEKTYRPSRGRHVTLSGAQRERYARLVESWRVCGCGKPMGMHTLSDRCAS